MNKTFRRLALGVALVTAVLLGTFSPDPLLFGVDLMAAVLGVAIVGISAGRLWHSDDYPTRCSFIAMLIGLTSFPVSHVCST